MADAQGLSYYGASTLAQRLHLSTEELGAARQQLIELELVAYQAPLYQVLAISAPKAAPHTVPASASLAAPAAPSAPAAGPGGPVSLAQLLGQLEHRRGRL